MNFPPRAGRVSGRATPSLRHAPRAKLQRTNPGSSPLSLRGILFKRSGPALPSVEGREAARSRSVREERTHDPTGVLEGVTFHNAEMSLRVPGGGARTLYLELIGNASPVPVR